MLLLVSTQEQDAHEKLQQMRYIFYSRIFKQKLNIRRNLRKYYDECPTQEALPRIKTGLQGFNSLNCRFSTYAECAQEQKEIFDRWSSHKNLCLNCSTFLKANNQAINMFLRNLFLLPQFHQRGLIKTNGKLLRAIFLEMEEKSLCLNGPQIRVNPPQNQVKQEEVVENEHPEVKEQGMDLEE